MSFLAGVTKGKIRQPILTLVFGTDGVGKSSFAAGAPSPVFLGTEKGTANLDVARGATPTSFKEVLAAIDELRTGKHDFQTLAIDSLDWLEPLVWEQVCVDNSWKDIEAPGFGKGYVAANRYWLNMMGELTKLRDERRMNIVLIAHAQVKLAKDPHAQAEYDRYQLKLNDKAAALWREYVDSVLFANYETFVKTEKGKTRAMGDGARYLFTERRAGHDGKNRYGLPYQLPLSWEDFAQAVDAGNPDDPVFLMTSISELVGMISDETTKQKVLQSVEASKTDPTRLARILDRLRAVTNAA